MRNGGRNWQPVKTVAVYQGAGRGIPSELWSSGELAPVPDFVANSEAFPEFSLDTVSKQVDKIRGFKLHSEYSSMRAYINWSLLKGALVVLPALAMIGPSAESAEFWQGGLPRTRTPN
jgi:hypothetical protein